MKITLTGALGNIGHRLTTQLVEKGHTVTVISSDPERAVTIRNMGAIPAIGSIADYAFISTALKDADAAYLMIPPNYRSDDLKTYIKTTGEQYARAIKASNICHVVNLSSIGAHLPEGPGPTGANHYVERRLNELENVNVLHLRPGMFYTNFLGSMDMIRYQNRIGNNFDSKVKLPLSHPQDIANLAAHALHDLSFTGKTVRYVVSDEKTGDEICTILGQATGKSGLQWMNFRDEDLLETLIQNGLSEQMALVYIVEMGKALKDGSFMEDYNSNGTPLAGAISFQEFARTFAALYHQSI
jgi:uncharacterized protein YbjT (DUF2867 family)